MNAKIVVLAYWAVGALAALNFVVCSFVIRSSYYSRGQKFAQCAIVWLLPVLGPFVIGFFLYGQSDHPIFNTPAYPERDEKGVSEVEPAVYESGGHGSAAD